MSNTRIKDLSSSAIRPASDDYLVIDGETSGTRKIKPADLRSGDGLTTDIKEALLQIAEKVAYIDDQGQDYYDELYGALYPPAVLISINATYTQSGTVYDLDSLDSLKDDLVVTGSFDDSTTRPLQESEYVLSGELTTGESTITVTSGEQTDTFTVEVTHATAIYNISSSFKNCSSSNNASRIGDGESYTATITADEGNLLLGAVVTMGGDDITSTAYANGVITIASVTGDITVYASAGAMTIIPCTWANGGINGMGKKVNPDNNRYKNYYTSNYIPIHVNQSLVLYNTDPTWTNKNTYNGTDYIKVGAVAFQVTGTDGQDDGTWVNLANTNQLFTTEGSFFVIKYDENDGGNVNKVVSARLEAYNMAGYYQTAVVAVVDGV